MSLENFLDCRRDLSIALRSAAASGADFAPKDQQEQMPRDREYALRHVKLDIVVDFPARAVRGTTTHRLQAVNAGLRIVKLDAVDMVILKTRALGEDLEFEYDGRKLDVRLPRALKEGEVVELAIRYEAKPRKGMFFIAPEPGRPPRTRHIWTQGEMEDNRNWFPSYDYPNQRCTSEVIVDLPGDWVAVANGRMLDETPLAKGRRKWHFLQDKEHVNYLITLVAGEFEVVKDSVDGIPLEYWAPNGSKRDEIAFSFQATPDILRFFAKATGLKFPFAKLTQVVVQDFTFGGMENTTLITLYEGTLHDKRAVPDYRVEGLLAHEAAHQWFGDLMTCRSWGHLWLNESFATYFSALYAEHKWGKEEFQHQMMGIQANYLAEATGHYQRSIVTLRYKDPEDMFDRHSYEKGACVLHSLRSVLGDDLFFKAIRHYAKTRQNTIVETNDLKEAIEESTGRNLDWFFRQWVYSPGHPDLEISWEWDGGANAARVKVKQRQRKDEKSEVPLFRMPVEIELLFDGDVKKGKKGKNASARAERRTVELTRAEEEFHLPCKQKPKTLVFDPDHWLLAKREFKKPKPELVFQAQRAPTVHARMLACEGLATHFGDDGVVGTLRDVMGDDAFHGVRRAAARTLGELRSEEARSVLEKGARNDDSRVRRAIYDALGKFQDDRAVSTLSRAARQDASDYAAAAAVHALGATLQPKAFTAIAASLGRKSHFDAVERAACAALAALRDERGFDLLKKESRKDRPTFVRAAAIESLGALADALDKRRREVREFVEPALRDREFRIRTAVTASLVEMAEPESIGLLRRLDADLFARSRRYAERGAATIAEKHAEKAQRRDFGAQLEEVKKESIELKKRLGRLEGRFDAKKGKR